jgi:hypothetical protein
MISSTSPGKLARVIPLELIFPTSATPIDSAPASIPDISSRYS